MLTEAQLAKAIEQGIISSEQAQQLELIVLQDIKDNIGKQSAEVAPAPDETPGTAPGETQQTRAVRDEAPRFVRSFNDLFVAMGVGVLGFAVFYALKLVSNEQSEGLNFAAPFLAAGMFWLLGEWLTARRRLNFPSIIISLFFTFFIARGFATGAEHIFQTSWTELPKQGGLIIFGLISLTLGVYFWRFKLPFSILLFAGSITLCVITGLHALIGEEFTSSYVQWIMLAIGLSIFAAAMWFDTNDPLRTQRTSDQGFWLHLLAAPLITHSALWNSLRPLMKTSEISDAASGNLIVGIVLGLFALFSVIALIIDRRALLISSLGYASAAFGYIIYKFEFDGNIALILTLVVIATLILTLGTGWYKLRRALFSILPKLDMFKKLPPLTA